MQISTIGLDLAKNVFQAHGVSAEGKVVLKKQLRRGQVLSTFAKLPPCLVGMEACAGAHYWAREIGKLGHDVRLMLVEGRPHPPYRGSTSSPLGWRDTAKELEKVAN